MSGESWSEELENQSSGNLKKKNEEEEEEVFMLQQTAFSGEAK